jgi:hypothetical protein
MKKEQNLLLLAKVPFGFESSSQTIFYGDKAGFENKEQ